MFGCCMLSDAVARQQLLRVYAAEDVPVSEVNRCDITVNFKR